MTTAVTPSASLPATLAATVDSLVTLTLTISNPSIATVDVIFASGQQFDFAISDSGGALLWQWSTGLAFAQMFGTKSIAPNGSLVYAAQWKPIAHGVLNAVGSLVSTSHVAVARTLVAVP